MSAGSACAGTALAHPERLEVLWRFADVDRVTRVIRPYLEAVG